MFAFPHPTGLTELTLHCKDMNQLQDIGRQGKQRDWDREWMMERMRERKRPMVELGGHMLSRLGHLVVGWGPGI